MFKSWNTNLINVFSHQGQATFTVCVEIYTVSWSMKTYGFRARVKVPVHTPHGKIHCLASELQYYAWWACLKCCCHLLLMHLSFTAYLSKRYCQWLLLTSPWSRRMFQTHCNTTYLRYVFAGIARVWHEE